MLQIRERAKAKKLRVVLPEGTEPRIILAAKKLLSEGMASVTLLGDENEVSARAKEHGLNTNKVQIVNPISAVEYNSYVAELVEIRKSKGLSQRDAQALIASPLYFGAMLVRHDLADASVAGSVNTTGDVLRAALHVIGMKTGINTVSSSFLMVMPKFHDVRNKAFLFGDCAVVPNPSAEQLATIALSTSETFERLIGEKPRVALLSFSTKGSASHPDVDKVLMALKILKSDHPDLEVDGELQLDAAIMPEVAARKAPESSVAGKANVLIFPDLDSGNIGYKLTERFGGATAIGPILQGLAKPANDLSRGCTVDDIVDTVAIALLMKG
ncbi:MAG: phosphate acetyltransferase [candidate division Zixibacteria bacterium]|nr:phosphate acetyltransferase [candidate division Zixibacteria bacterium]